VKVLRHLVSGDLDGAFSVQAWEAFGAWVSPLTQSPNFTPAHPHLEALTKQETVWEVTRPKDIMVH
jgi:hypothetical protein